MTSCHYIAYAVLKFLIFIFCIKPGFSSADLHLSDTGSEKVLFIGNSDHEQSQVFLATCQSLIQYPFVDIHFASFPELTDETSNLKIFSNLSRVTFHQLHGTPYAKRLEQEEYRLTGLSHPPGFYGAAASRKGLPTSWVPWNDTEYLETYRSMLDVIEKVDPRLVIIDPLLRQANDAVVQLGYKYMILSGSNLRDLLVTQQPVSERIREYPAIGSGFSYPLPWYLAFNNAYLWLQRAFTTMSSSRIRRLKSCRQQYGVTKPVNLVDWYREDAIMVVASSLEIEYPISVPPNVVASGPIIPRASPVISLGRCWQDCLKCWHDSQQLVLLIDLQRLTEADAKEVARALVFILVEYEHLQVLWNIGNHTENSETDNVHAVVDSVSFISHRRTRKLQLNPAGISSLLASDSISCLVHRGETGLFHDALTAGVPQLLVPKWQIDYNNAVQAEWLGVGKWVNRAHAPLLNNEELVAAVRGVLNQERDGVHIAKRADAIRSLLQASPGQDAAAQEIIKRLHLPENRTKGRFEAISDEL